MRYATLSKLAISFRIRGADSGERYLIVQGSLPGRIPSAANGIHRALRLNETAGIDLVPLPFRVDRCPDSIDDHVVGGPVSHQRLDVGFFQAEQAVSQFSVCCDAEPVD